MYSKYICSRKHNKGNVYPITGLVTLNGSRGIALPILNLGTRRGGWSAPRPGHFTAEKDPVPSVQEAGWAPGPVWTWAKNHAPTGIRSSDGPARSQPLCRLSYRAHERTIKYIKNPGGGEIFRTRPDRPWGPSSLLYNEYRGFPGDKAARAWC
jgi:hypothetical protein